MPNLDDELRRRLQRAGRRVDTDGLEGRLHERLARKQIVQKTGQGMLVVAVLAGSAFGIAGLNRAFRGDRGAGEAVPDAGGTVAFVRNLRPCPEVPDTGGIGGLELFTVDVVTGEQRNVPLRYEYPDDPQRSTSPQSPEFSPDGTKVVWRDYYTYGIFVTDVATGATQPIARRIDGLEPHWSPDGSMLLFSGTSGNQDADPRDLLEGGYGIYTAAADGSALTQLTDTGRLPTWTADGRIAYIVQQAPTASIDPDTGRVRESEPAPLHFFVMNADGSGAEEVYEAPGDVPIRDAEWSPDGNRIVAEATLRGNTDIFVVDLTLRTALRMTDDPATDTSPSWSPDASVISFHTGRWGTGIGHSEIAVMHADGTGIRRLTDDCWDDYDATWVRDDSAVHTLPVWMTPLIEATPPPSGGSPQPIAGPTDQIPGLHGNLCRVSTAVADFGRAEPGTAYTFERQTGDQPGCLDPGHGDPYVAIALEGTRYSAATGPLSCDPVCDIMATVDLNGDGVDEVLVATRRHYPAEQVLLQVFGVTAPASGNPHLVPVVREDGEPLVVSWGSGGAGTWNDGVTCSRTPAPTFTHWRGTSPDAGTTWTWRKTVYAMDIGADEVVARTTSESRESTTNPDGPKIETICGEEILAG